MTGIVAVLEAASPLAASWLVAVTSRSKLPLYCGGGVITSWKSAQSVTVVLVLPAVAVKLCVPSDSVAPTGICPMVTTEIASEPSVSDSATPTGGKPIVPLSGAVLVSG